MKTIFFALLSSFALLACDACGPSGRRPAATITPREATLPTFPFWTAAQSPDGDRAEPNRLAAPAGAATLVATGFLLASIEGMRDVADDPGADATVWLHDGTRWVRGRYVDRDHGLRLALIRADMPGAPLGISKAAGPPERLAGIPALVAERLPITLAIEPIRPCDELPAIARELLGDERPAYGVCAVGKVHELPGGVFLDREDRIAGIQVFGYGSPARVGPDAAALREYLDTYFASWGSAVRPKPSY
jgi:hypothetical protein